MRLFLAALLLTACTPESLYHYGPLQGLYCDNDSIYTTNDLGDNFEVIEYDWEGNRRHRFEVNYPSHGADLNYIPQYGLFTTQTAEGGGVFLFNSSARLELILYTQKCLTHADSEYWIFLCGRTLYVHRAFNYWPMKAVLLPETDLVIQGLTRHGDTVYILHADFEIARLASIEMGMHNPTVKFLDIPQSLTQPRAEPEGLAWCAGSLYTSVNYGPKKRVRQKIFRVGEVGLEQVIVLEGR